MGKNVTGKSARRKRVKAILDDISSGNPDVHVHVASKRPYTCVQVSIHDAVNGEFEYGVGFSKVCWPDVYDPIRGYEIALAKAVGDLVDNGYVNGLAYDAGKYVHDEHNRWTAPV